MEEQWVEWTAATNDKQYVIGLSASSIDFENHEDIDFALHVGFDGSTAVFEKGAMIGSFGSYSIGDTLRVAVQAEAVTYSRNGLPFLTSTVVPTFPLRVVGSFYSPGGSATNVRLRLAGQDQIEAIPCPMGTYQPYTEALSCISCPLGEFTESAGSTECTLVDVVRRTDAADCAGAFVAGAAESGLYTLSSGLQVQCNMLHPDVVVTTIPVVDVATAELHGYEDACAGDVPLDYSAVGTTGNSTGTISDIRALVAYTNSMGGSCKQGFVWHCKGSGWSATAFGSAYQCLSSTAQKKNPLTPFGQSESREGTMLRSNHCAADPDGGTWRQDVGEVLDQSLLPVTNFHYGFSGAQCFDDPYWIDSDHGTGNDGCASMLANPSWCADFGTYSEAASAACPVACGSCHIDRTVRSSWAVKLELQSLVCTSAVPAPTAVPPSSPTAHPCEDGSHGCDLLTAQCTSEAVDDPTSPWHCECLQGFVEAAGSNTTCVPVTTVPPHAALQPPSLTWMTLGASMRAEQSTLTKLGVLSADDKDGSWADGGAVSFEAIEQSPQAQWVEWTAGTSPNTYVIGLSSVWHDNSCFDEPLWVDSDYGTGNEGCASMLANPSWCADFGTYSLAASAACPASCGACPESQFSSIDFALHLGFDGSTAVFEKGAMIGSFGSYSIGDTLRVAVQAEAVTYSRNSLPFLTSMVVPTFPLRVVGSFYSPGGSATNVQLIRCGDVLPTTVPSHAPTNLPCGDHAHGCNLTSTRCVRAGQTYVCECLEGFVPSLSSNRDCIPTEAPSVTPTIAPSHSPTQHPCDDGPHGCDTASTACAEYVTGSGTADPTVLYTCKCIEGFVADPRTNTSCVSSPSPSASPSAIPTASPAPTASPTTGCASFCGGEGNFTALDMCDVYLDDCAGCTRCAATIAPTSVPTGPTSAPGNAPSSAPTATPAVPTAAPSSPNGVSLENSLVLQAPTVLPTEAPAQLRAAPDCTDDDAWRDSDHGTGNEGCASMLANPSWCTDFGTYSEAASAACPVACGSCHIDPFKVTPEPTSDPTTIPHWVSHAPLSSPPSTPLALTSPSPSPSSSPVVVGKGDFDAHSCAQHHCTNTCSHSTLFLRHRPGNCGGE
jgi:hypothetical protein